LAHQLVVLTQALQDRSFGDGGSSVLPTAGRQVGGLTEVDSIPWRVRECAPKGLLD
jgi:hypothetical protein